MRLLFILLLIGLTAPMPPLGAGPAKLRSISVLNPEEGPCSELLVMAGGASRLRIGVLFETEDGHLILGIADRVAEHIDILSSALRLESGTIKKILWTGELWIFNREVQSGLGRIEQVNNTSSTGWALFNLVHAADLWTRDRLMGKLSPNIRITFEEALTNIEFVQLSNNALAQALSRSAANLVSPDIELFSFEERPHLGNQNAPTRGSNVSGATVGERMHDLLNSLAVIQTAAGVMLRKNQAFDFQAAAYDILIDSKLSLYRQKQVRIAEESLLEYAATLDNSDEDNFEMQLSAERDRLDQEVEARVKAHREELKAGANIEEGVESYLLDLERLSWLASVYVGRGQNHESLVIVLEHIQRWIDNKRIDGNEQTSHAEIGTVLREAIRFINAQLNQDRKNIEFFILEESPQGLDQ